MAKQEHDVRRQGAQAQPPQAMACGPGSQIGQSGGEHERVMRQIRLCLAQLEEPGRDLMRLKFVEGLSYQQLSERTGLSVNMVGSILHKALQRVAAELENAGLQL